MTTLLRAFTFVALAVGSLCTVCGTMASPVQSTTGETRQLLDAPFRAAHLPEPPVATNFTSLSEDRALAAALSEYSHRARPDDYTVLVRFLGSFPHSGWTSAIATNLGLLYFHDGFYTKALDAFRTAWKEGRAAPGQRARIPIDGAVGKLVWLEASIGKTDQTESLLKEIKGRPITGSATEDVQIASEILAKSKNDKNHLFLCGPQALATLMARQGASHDDVRFVHTYIAGPKGTSLAEVSKLASDHRFKNRLIFRKEGQAVPIPSVVHWRVGHFAAIVGRTGSRYEVKDPVFPGLEAWVTLDALNDEASGYFLVPASLSSDPGWREVPSAEAASIWGKGPTMGTRAGASNDPPANKGPDAPPPCPLCNYNIAEAAVALTLSDTPIGYKPPIGPSTKTTISYNQREASQPQTFGFYNLSPKWTINWLSYVTDDPTTPGASVSRYLSGGGAFYYSGYSATTGRFSSQDSDGSVLVLTSQSPVTYQRRLSDGSVEIYNQSDGSTSYPRNIFLSQVVDPQGNTLTLSYDSSGRLTSLVDATGRQTTFAYGLEFRPLLVTAITDPFGRSATMTYDALGRLKSITDILGLTSSFAYDTNSLVEGLTTPYGKTTFSYTAPGTSSPPRFVQVADAMGFNEREEWLEPAPVADSDPANTVPQGTPSPLINQYLEYRNSYHWDKNAYVVAGCTPTGGCNYTKARSTHFNHQAGTSDIKGTSVESVKYALENRIWNLYPGQVNSLYGGTYQTPAAQARVLDDGTTQLRQWSFDTAGYFKLTQSVDPLGRTTSYSYPNHIDLAAVTQTTASGDQLIAQLIYNARHRPLYYTDASGQTTRFSYNDTGQVTSVVDPFGDTTLFAYDSAHNLSTVTNANNATAAAFTYDAFDRVATYTDSEGWTVGFAYDAADRITQITYLDGTTDKYSYDRLDLVSYTDRIGRTWTYSYDANRRLVSTIDPSGATTSFAYNHDGKLTKLTDAKGNVTGWTYDVEGRVASKIYADTSMVAYTYENTTSRLKSVTDALGQIKQFAYAADDRVTGLAYQNATNPTPNVTLSYDPYFPRITSMIDGTGTKNYIYNAVGALGALRLQQESGPLANSAISYGYDAIGRLASRSVAQATRQTFQYDAIGRLTSETNDLGTFAFSYLGQTGQITNRALNGSSVATSWGYLPNANDRRLASVSNTGINTATFSNYQLTTDAEAFIRAISETSDASAAYPPVTTQSASYNTLNQLINLSGQALTYDANGNLLSDGQRIYTWDAENRLVAITYPGQPGKTTAFAYDGLGRRTMTASTPAGGNATATSYLWCGSRICQARNAANTVQRTYYDEGERVFGASPQSLFYGVDQIGSVRRVFASSGNPSAYSYDPYGNAISSTTHVTDFGFAGMFTNADSELYLAWFRTYDPLAGRWLSRDPIALMGFILTSKEWSQTLASSEKGNGLPTSQVFLSSARQEASLISDRGQASWLSPGASLPLILANADLNLYSYVEDNPLSITDPSGLAPGDKRFGLPDAFWDWYHRCVKQKGDPDLNYSDACAWHAEWCRLGKPSP